MYTTLQNKKYMYCTLYIHCVPVYIHNVHVHVQPTAPVLKAGHPVSYFCLFGWLVGCLFGCLFVSWDRGFLGFFLLLSVCFASGLYTCMHVHVYTYIVNVSFHSDSVMVHMNDLHVMSLQYVCH